MKIEIKKINLAKEGQKEPKEVIKQIEEIINSEEILLKQEITERIGYTNWKENISSKSNWEEVKNYGNQVLALILINRELIAAEKIIKAEKQEAIDECVGRLEEMLSLNDTDLKVVLNWTFGANNYEEKVNKMLSKLAELEEEMNHVGSELGKSSQWLVDEEVKNAFLKEIENLSLEKRVADWQINDKLVIRLRNNEVSDYRELVKKKVYSQEKLEKWKHRLTKVVQQIELEEKWKEILRNKPFNLAEFKRVREELAELVSRGWEKAERPEKIPLKKKQEELIDFKKEFGLVGSGEKVKRTVKKKEEIADDEVAKGWYKVSGELNLNAKGSLNAWKNGWNYYSERNFVRKDLPYSEPREKVGIWVQEFEKVEKEKKKQISTDEIVEWWKHSSITGLKAKKSADAWGNGWNYNEIKNGLGSITPNTEGTFNIPVNQARTLGEEKAKALVKLVKFFWAESQDKKEELKLVYKKEIEGINKATTSEQVQELLKNYVKKVAYDQIKYALVNSVPSLREDDLTPESQKNISILTDKNVSSDVEFIKEIRNKLLEDIKGVEELFDIKEKLRELFSEEIEARIKSVQENNWKINLDQIDEKEWKDYINELDIRSNDSEVCQRISDNLLEKIKQEVEKKDNEGKPWEPNFSNEDWEEIKSNFSYDQITDEEEVKTINIDSVVVAAKKMAISKWEKKIEEKVGLAKEMSEQEERTDEEVQKLITELDLIAQWESEKDGSNQKESLKNKQEEFHSSLELLRYKFYLSLIKKASSFTETDRIAAEIGKKMRGVHLPPGKKANDLRQALSNQEALITLRKIIDDSVPTDISKINEELEKLRSRATEAEESAYYELNKDGAVDKKELELMKAKHLKVNDKGEKWKYNLTEEYNKLISNSRDKNELSLNLRAIEKHFRFRADFYNVTEITPSPENDQLIDKYQKLKLGGGERVGLIYKSGWTNPTEINEQGLASLDRGKDGYPYDVRSTSRLQAEIMRELQAKIEEVKAVIDATSQERVAGLRMLSSFNEEWVNKSENDLEKQARAEALKWKRYSLAEVRRELSKKEIELIWNDLSDESKYQRDPVKLEELVGERIAALDDNYIDSQKRNKDLLNKIKETLKERLKFRTDFLEVIGDEKGEISDEFIYNYWDKGLGGGKQAGQVYLTGWKDPTEIARNGYVNLSKKYRFYSFSVTELTREQAKEEMDAEEKLGELIYEPKLHNDLEGLKTHLNDLESLIPQDNNDPDSDKPLHGENLLTLAQKLAYRRNENEANRRRKELLEEINNFQRKVLVDEIDSALQKLNSNIWDINQEEEAIQVDLSSTRETWEKKLKNPNSSLEEIKRVVVTPLTREIRAILIKRLNRLCAIKPGIEFGKLGIVSFDNYLPIRASLAELVEKGENIIKKIAEVRGKEKKSAADALNDLISKGESENFLEFRDDLDKLQSLIPLDIEEGESLNGRKLTTAEIEAYQEKKKEVDEKELNLLKKIAKYEIKEQNPNLEERKEKLIDKAEDKSELEMVKKQLLFEWQIEKKMQSIEKILKDQKVEKGNLLDEIHNLEGYNDSKEEEGEEWKEKAWFSKRKKAGEIIKRLRIKIKEQEFAEYIKRIEKETEFSELDSLVGEWNRNLLEGGISDEEMSAGKKRKDLLIAIDKRKKEIKEGNLSQNKAPEEKLEETENERDAWRKKVSDLQQSLATRGINIEEDNWDNVLQAIDEKITLGKKIGQIEKILGVSLEELENQESRLPFLDNLIEVANLLTMVGVEQEKHENGRVYYDREKLKNSLADLIKKGQESDSLRKAVEGEKEKMKQLNEILEKAKEEKEKLSHFISSLDVESLKKYNEDARKNLQKNEAELKVKKTEVENQKSIIGGLGKQLTNANEQINDLRTIIANNINQKNEEQQKGLKERQKIIELMRKELTSSWGKKQWRELEAKIEALEK